MDHFGDQLRQNNLFQGHNLELFAQVLESSVQPFHRHFDASVLQSLLIIASSRSSLNDQS